MNDYFSDWRVSSGYNVLFVNLTSMQVCKFGQPGKYVRLEGVDVHADANRPAGANPTIMVINAIIWGYATGCFFHWYPPKKLKYGKPRLSVSTLM